MTVWGMTGRRGSGLRGGGDEDYGYDEDEATTEEDESGICLFLVVRV